MTSLFRLAAPASFDFVQFWVGGTVAKRRLVLGEHSRQKRVLEVGCATGNIAAGFIGLDVEYTGLDIDPDAVAYAARKFERLPNFTFVCGALERQVFARPFDFIVFPGVLHHVDDGTASSMLEHSRAILAPDGLVVVSDPVQPRPQDGIIVRLFRHVERGRHLRTVEDLSGLLANLHGLRVIRHACHGVAALPVGSGPTVATFAVFVLEPRPEGDAPRVAAPGEADA